MSNKLNNKKVLVTGYSDPYAVSKRLADIMQYHKDIDFIPHHHIFGEFPKSDIEKLVKYNSPKDIIIPEELNTKNPLLKQPKEVVYKINSYRDSSIINYPIYKDVYHDKGGVMGGKTKSENNCFVNRVTKRRKKNKNKKTHRK